MSTAYRILQVVPLITPDGAYGGPVRVAVGQCAALGHAGHDVVLTGGTWGFDAPPEQIEGVRTCLFPARSVLPGSTLGGLIAPAILPWARRALRTADVVHIHLARDLITLPVARLCAALGTPFVLQTHGMVVESRNPLSGPLDAALTRSVMRAAGRVFYLTEAERASLQTLFPGSRLELLRNGIAEPSLDHGRRDVEPIEVLFLARIQQRKRPLDFVAMAARLAPRFPQVRFTLVGPDEGLGAQVRDAIARTSLGERLQWIGPVAPEDTAAIMRRAAIYVLPSVDEPYPMSVIEALAHGLPTIVTDTCGLAPLVAETGSGAVVRADVDDLCDAVAGLLENPQERARVAGRARRAAVEKLGIGAVTSQLLEAYASIQR